MSTDLLVYSPAGTVLACEELSSLIQPKGWTLLFVEGAGPYRFPNTGPFADGYVYGVRRSDVALRLQDLLSREDDDGIEKLGEEEDIGGCEYLAVTPYSFAEQQGEEALANWIRGGDAELEHALRGAKVEYTLTIRGTNTESGSLQVHLARGLASATRGLLCCPQSGRFDAFSTGSARILKKGQVPAEFEALEGLARQAGLPIDEEGVHTDQMTPPQVEQYLTLCEANLSTLFYNVVLELTLDEVRRAARRSGDPHRVTWFEGIQRAFQPKQQNIEDLLRSLRRGQNR